MRGEEKRGEERRGEAEAIQEKGTPMGEEYGDIRERRSRGYTRNGGPDGGGSTATKLRT